MKIHLYSSANMLGDCYGACGIMVGHVRDVGGTGFRPYYADKKKKITCKRCKRTRVYKES